MFSSPYKTTPFQSFQFAKTAQAIKVLEIDEKLVKLTPAGNILAVPRGVVEFPAFDLPLTKDQVPTMNADVIIDGRNLLKADGTPAKLDVFQFYLHVAKLTAIWSSDSGDTNISDIKDLGNFPIKIYGTWVRNALSNPKVGLDFQQTFIVMAAAMVFYYQLHTPLTTNSSGRDMDAIYNRVARALPGYDDPAMLAAQLGDIPVLENVKDLCDWIQKILDNPKASALTPSLLFTAVGYSWGGAYRSMATAAVEYPPIFLSMMYHSIQSRSYTRTSLGELIKRTARRGEDVEFTKSLSRLVSVI